MVLAQNLEVSMSSVGRQSRENHDPEKSGSANISRNVSNGVDRPNRKKNPQAGLNN